MNNEDRRKKAEMLGLVMMHCASQQAMYDEALKNEGGYKPKTNIFEILTLAEAHSGGAEVVAVVSAILAGACSYALVDPVAALIDLVMAIKYKTKFYDPKKEPNNIPVKTLNDVYIASLDVVNNTLWGGDVPSDVADKVCDFIYE